MGVQCSISKETLLAKLSQLRTMKRTYAGVLDAKLGKCTLKEPFAVRHQDMHSLRRHFHLKFFSVVISDPNSKKNTGGPFWNPLVPLKTTQ